MASRPSVVLALALVVNAAAIATPAAAQGHAASHAVRDNIPRALLERPPTRRSGIGTAHEAVHTGSREAQAWYDTGLAHLHSFAWIEAAQAFHAALRHDPTLAMAHVGLSFAYGGLGSLPAAIEAANRATAGVASVPGHDRSRIELRRLQLQVASGAVAVERYVAALDRALMTAPRDVELLLLRGEAAGGAVAGGGRESGAEAVTFFKRAQQAAPDAFAPRHYLAHAYENSHQVALALVESQAYVTLAPEVPHAHHMVAHSLRQLGRTPEAIDAFERAAALARTIAGATGVGLEYDWHAHHNTALLASAYRYAGRLREAERLLAPAFAIAAPLLPEELSKRDWPALLLALGRTSDALTAARQLSQHRDPIVSAAGHLAAAQVQLTSGETGAAAAAADAALSALRNGGPDAAVLAPDLRLAQGLCLLQTGDRERARAMVRDAVASWRARTGPDAWSDTLFAIESAWRIAERLGDAPLVALLTDALAQHDPLYAGTALARGRAAEARGDRATARAAYADAVSRWSTADAGHPDLIVARTRLAALR